MINARAETMNQHPSTSPVRGFVGQAAEVTGNVIELAELQVQLAKEDAAEAIQIAIKPIFTIVIGGVLLLASLPVLLLAIAGLISRYSGMNLELAQLIVGLCATVIAVAAVLLSVRTVKSSLAPFNRSTQEFKQNVSWLKTIFRSTNT